jgi:hypothetical protein
MSVSTKVKIMFLAANPKDTSQLRLDEEIREIHLKIRAAEFRDSFDLMSRWAVRPLDLLQALNEVQPDVVHFSGHGAPSTELILEDDAGNAKPVSAVALASLFTNLKDNVRLVVLNACHSEAQAQAISEQIDCTVGMNAAIGDEAAVVFACTFYGALAFGRSVGQAFEQGRTALLLQGIPEENTPLLLSRPGADAFAVSFVDRRPVNPVLPPVALEILQSAVFSNSPINFARYDGGLFVQTDRNFDCQYDLEKAAQLEHAITMLVQVGWIKQTSPKQYHVTRLGYQAVRGMQARPSATFLRVKEQMPALIAEMKHAVESDEGKFVREFFVMSKNHVLGGSEKPRFIFFEEDHNNLLGMIDILENRGYVIDVMPGNTPILRMTEEFVSLVDRYG